MRKLCIILFVVLSVGCQNQADNNSNINPVPEDTMTNTLNEENQGEAPALDEEVSEPETTEVTESNQEDLDEALSEDRVSPDYTLPENFTPRTYTLEVAFPGMTFDRPLYLTGYKDWIFVVEKGGVIYKFQPGLSEEKIVFLDISAQIGSTSRELGLLGLALDPDFEKSAYIYVYYTKDKASVISRFSVNQYMMKIRRDSELVILTFDQPYNNHNGGHLAFGRDGYLYIGSGDGGSGGDPMNNGQNLTNPLGKILRLDVKNINETKTYFIPEDNPFKDNDQGYDETIYAYGLRNPWRFSFDPGRDILLVADVGQDKVEEINLVEMGQNYGWPKYEGTSLYKDLAIDGQVVMPIWEYQHPLGKSITGGYTYYGQKTPSLYGVYLYGDFITGRLWGLWLDEDMSVSDHELLDSDLMIASFGYVEGEVYIVDYRGKIYELRENEN